MSDQLEVGAIREVAAYRNYLRSFLEQIDSLFQRFGVEMDYAEDWIASHADRWARRVEEAESELGYARARLDDCLADENRYCTGESYTVDEWSQELSQRLANLKETSALRVRIFDESESARTLLMQSCELVIRQLERGIAYLDRFYGGLEEYRRIALGVDGAAAAGVGGPAGAVDDGLGYRRFEGPVFAGQPSAEQVHQGAIGDCYLMGPLAAVAAQSPDLIRDSIRDNGDGTYSVRLYEEQEDGTYQPFWVTVTADFPVHPESGQVLYGGTSPTNSDGLWVSLFEKAYAEYHGGYENIGDGGRIEDALSTLTGERPLSRQYDWSAIREALARGASVCAGKYNTHGDIPGRHAYAVTGVQEEQGRRYVILLNPWGDEAHESGYGGRFRLEEREFMRVFDEVVL